MGFVDRSQPPEPDDPPDPVTETPGLAAERDRLRKLVRRGIRSRNQERILRRIAEITRHLLAERKTHELDQ